MQFPSIQWFSLEAGSHLGLRKVSIHRSVNLTDSIGTIPQPVRLGQYENEEKHRYLHSIYLAMLLEEAYLDSILKATEFVLKIVKKTERSFSESSRLLVQILNLMLFETRILRKEELISPFFSPLMKNHSCRLYRDIYRPRDITYNCIEKYDPAPDDRKTSITCENDDKTARRSLVYKIPERYFRRNAFSQIRGCPSLGTKSHGSISRARALHAREISERRQSEFLEAALRAIKM